MKTINLKYLMISVLTGLILCNLTFGQTEIEKQIKDLVYKGSISFQNQPIIEASAICERILSDDENNKTIQYYLAYTQYLKLKNSLAMQDKTTFDKYYDETVESINKLKDDDHFGTEAKILLANTLMNKIALYREEAPMLASKIYELLGEAEQTEPENPRIFLLKGMMLFHMPEMMGGGLKNSLPVLEKTKVLYESTKEVKTIDWGYLDALAWLGQNYSGLGQIDKAKETYKKVLETEPEFVWVKNVLLPAVEKSAK